MTISSRRQAQNIKFPDQNLLEIRLTNELFAHWIKEICEYLQVAKNRLYRILLLDAQNSGLNTDEIRDLTIGFLKSLEIECEIWEFNPNADDDLYDKFVMNFDIKKLKECAKK